MERNTVIGTLNKCNQFLFDLVVVALSTGMLTYGLHGAFHNITLAFFIGAVIIHFVIKKKVSFTLPWPFLAFQAVLFCIYCFHGLFSHGWDSDLAHMISNKSPILVFPILFACMPYRKSSAYFIFFLFTLLWLDIESIGALNNYYKDLANEKIYTWSSVIHVNLIPFAIMHHHLSMYVAFGFAIAIYLLLYTEMANTWYWRLLLIIQLVFFFVFEHILAARIGLVLTYLSLLIGIVMTIFRFSSYPKSTTLILIVFLGIGFSFFSTKLPTLNKKIAETIQDFKSISDEGISTKYNISARLFSYKLAWNMFKNNPIKGVGYLAFDNKTIEIYETAYPEIYYEQRIICPNQFLKYLTCFGWPTFVLFISAFFGPLLLFIRKPFLTYFILIGFTSGYFMTEYPLENINFYYFFSFYSCLLLHFHLAKENKPIL